MDDQTDWQLWRRTQSGDGEAFAVLFDRYARTVYNFCFRRTASWVRAEDLVSEVFLEAWRKRLDVQLAPDQRLLPWLFAVAHNKARNEGRASARLRSLLARLTSSPMPDVAEDANARVDDEQRMGEILGAVRDLPPGELDVLILYAWGQLEYQEVADLLGIPIGTVRSRLARARARLEDVPRAVDFRRRSRCDGQAVRTIAASLPEVRAASTE